MLYSLHSPRVRWLARFFTGRRSDGFSESAARASGTKIERLEARTLLAVDPGNSMATARDLGTLAANVSIDECVGTSDPSDWYRFTVDTIRDVYTDVSNTSVRQALILDKNGNTLLDGGEQIVTDKGYSITLHQRLEPGTYYLRLSTSSSDKFYTLTFATTVAPQDPGESMDTAWNFGTLTGNAGNSDWVGAADPSDWYRFTLGTTRDVYTSVSNSSVRQAIIQDKNANGLLDSGEQIVSDQGYAITLHQRLAPGTYFLRLSTASSDKSYGVSVTTKPASTELNAFISKVTPDPRPAAEGRLQIVFSEPITGLDIGDLRLTRNGGSNLLAGDIVLRQWWGDDRIWEILGLADRNRLNGTYRLTLVASGSGITSVGGGSALTADAYDEWTVAFTPDANVTYLSDLAPTSAVNGYGPYERDISNGEQFADDGGVLTLNGHYYGKGLGVHSSSDIVYDLDGKYTSFLGDVGLDDQAGGSAAVVFQVFVDGVKLFDSGIMTGESSTKAVNVAVGGKHELRLVVTDGGNGKTDDHANWANARLIPSAAFGEVIVDNAAAALSGAWISSAASPGYLGANYVHDGNTGKGSKTATFTPNLAEAGTYDVYALWTSDTNRAGNVPYDVVHSGGTNTVMKSQKFGGGTWQLLGTWSFAAGTAGKVVIRTTGTSGYVIADAVRFVKRTTPFAGDVIVDNAAAALLGSWTTSTSTSGYVGSNYLHDGNTGKGTKSVTFTAALPEIGTYQVYARWTSGTNRADSVPYDVYASSGVQTVSKDQRVGGGTWVALGTFSFNTMSGKVVVRNADTSGYVIADAVRFVKVAGASGDYVLDNTVATTTGTWSSSTSTAGYLGSDYLHDGNIGKGAKSVRWTPNLLEGAVYQVYARWTSGSNRASNARYDITHAGGTESVFVDQRVNGGVWVLLGTYTFNAGTGGYVTLVNAGTNGYVIADAVRFVKV